MNALITKAQKEMRSTRLWQCLFVAAILGYSVKDWCAEQEQRKGTAVAIINGQTCYIGTALPEQYAAELHEMLGKQAANSVFSISDSGYTQKETIKHLFNTYSFNKLTEAWTHKDPDGKGGYRPSNQDMFKEQQIVQTFIPGQVARQVVDDRTVKVSVDGIVTQIANKVSALSNTPLAESFPERILVWLIRNDDWRDNNKFPMVVGDFKVEVNPGKR